MDLSARLLAAPFTEADYISGERVQSLCDITTTTRAKIAFHTSLDLPREKLYIFDEEDEAAILAQRQAMKEAQTVFCYGDQMELFIFSLMVDPCDIFDDGPMKVIIIHNSDQTFEQHHADAFCRHHAIASVFAQNCKVSEHPENLYPIPIGLANSMWVHGDVATLHKIRTAAASRPITRRERAISLYVNIREETNPGHRKDALDAIRKNGFRVTDPKLGYMAYLCGLSNSRFVACVRGNGVDSHRIWEALYLGAVPVVERDTPIYSQFSSKVPMVGIDTWDEVTEDFLREQDEILSKITTFQPDAVLALRGKL